MPHEILDLIHAHPVVTVIVFAWTAFGVFLWALFQGAEVPREELQQGSGDWMWPVKEEGPA